MTTVLKNTDLNDGTINTLAGWETSAAKGSNVVLYTANGPLAAYSDDGATFHRIDPWGLCRQFGEKPFCDQVVIYIPQIGEFAWVILTQAQNLVLALASPKDIRDSKGTKWGAYCILAKNFGDAPSTFDRPALSFGEKFLYITCNRGPIAIAIRLPLSELHAKTDVPVDYLVTDVFWLMPAQNTGKIGYFAALQGDAYNNLRVYSWPENSGAAESFNIPIKTIPSEDAAVKVPGGEWLANRRGSLCVSGLTLSYTQLWAAWFAHRKLAGESTNTFEYPHIGMAMVDVLSMKLLAQRFIWNPEYAFAFPALATNNAGEVGLSFSWGGLKHPPQYGVGMLTGPSEKLVNMTYGPSQAAGGDYTTIRQSFPDTNGFCAAGFNQTPQNVNHPHYVLFKP